ncbi:MAG TPA: CsbD family protein, partial [Candidatus Eisenbacteria bacterium]|nr:CsbD family protein [Candidatus Eisenbacteria bacterium]
MNRDIVAGKWQQLRGKVKEEWGKLTDDDLTMTEGK